MLEKNWELNSELLRPDLGSVFLIPFDDAKLNYDGSNRKAHIWNGIDALCKKYSNHPETRRLYQIVLLDENTIQEYYRYDLICKNCTIHEKKEYNSFMQSKEKEMY